MQRLWKWKLHTPPRGVLEESGMVQGKRTLVLFISIMVLMGVTSMNACGFLGFGKTASWKEEVLLHDGSKIVVERWQKHGGRGEIGQSPIKEQKITFTLPGSKRVITWKDEYSEDVGHSNFDLVALHISNGTPYIITTAYGCIAYNKWDRPNPPYIIFKLEGKGWKRIGLPELPPEFINVNLVINSSTHEEEIVSLSLVQAEKIRELNSSLTRDQEEYRTIIRTPLKPDALGVCCPVLVRWKDGWRSPDGPKAPIPVVSKKQPAKNY